VPFTPCVRWRPSARPLPVAMTAQDAAALDENLPPPKKAAARPRSRKHTRPSAGCRRWCWHGAARLPHGGRPPERYVEREEMLLARWFLVANGAFRR